MLTKDSLESIEDLSRGDHIVITSQHYLVQSVEHEHDKLTAFTTTIHKNIAVLEKHNIQQLVSENSIFLIKYDPHSTLAGADMSLEMVRMEMALNSKFQRSDQFVTKMKCGTEHLIDDRCYINHDVAMVGCTQVTSCTSVDEGDHLLIKDSERFYSVLVCRFVSQTSIVVIPPIKTSHSSHELEVIDLTAYTDEIYRVNYNQSLPSEEVIRRAQSCAGKDILQKSESANNNEHLVTWAKTGKEIYVPVQNLIKDKQIEILHPLEYKKILSVDELQVGQHIFRYEFANSYRKHFLITERNVDSKLTRFRVINCSHTYITEKVIDLDPGCVGKDIYQVIYQDELPTKLALERARSLKGKHKFCPLARLWFVPWAKTGSSNGIEVDLLRNLTKPASKSRIVCFTQLNKGDYLVEEQSHYVGRYHHYLVESVESPEKCTVIESWNGWIKKKVLNLGEVSTCDHPWFYRINYEPGICISAKGSIVKAQNVMKQQRWPYLPTSEYSRRSCIHYLKTGESADININGLLDERTLLQREVIKSAMELKPGDHIERPLSLAPNYAQHHMLVVRPIDDNHCEVIHYKVHQEAQIKTGEVVMETVNIFDQKVCYRICYLERIDPETGMANLRKLCGKKGKAILRDYTGNVGFNYMICIHTASKLVYACTYRH